MLKILLKRMKTKMKSKFNLIYERIMSSLINESGNMFDDTSKIKRENITPTLNKLYEEIFKPFGLPKDLYTAEIGSAASGGKKEESGDLDIAINFQALDELLQMDAKKNLREFIESKGYKVRQQGSVVSLRFPIQGSQLEKDEYVQIDLFNSNNLKFTEYKLRSPYQKFGLDKNAKLGEDESRYKGVHRNNFLASLIKAVTMVIADDAIDKTPYIDPDGRKYPATRYTHLTLLDNGIFEVTKSFIGVNGKIKKHDKKDDTKTEFITDNPQEMLDIIFGENKYKVSDTYSFESLWNNILMDPEFPYPDKRDDIVIALYYSFKDQVTMPDEIIDYIKEHRLTVKDKNEK